MVEPYLGPCQVGPHKRTRATKPDKFSEESTRIFMVVRLNSQFKPFSNDISHKRGRRGNTLQDQYVCPSNKGIAGGQFAVRAINIALFLLCYGAAAALNTGWYLPTKRISSRYWMIMMDSRSNVSST